MPNGKIGDHPLTDILIHDREIYSERARFLIREIVKLCDEPTKRKLGDRLFSQYNDYGRDVQLDLSALEEELEQLYGSLLNEAQTRRFDGNGLGDGE